MIIVLFVLVLALFIWSVYNDIDELPFLLLIVLSVIIVGAVVLTGLLVNTRTIDDKLVMYQEENQRIEESINALVKEYMEYEGNTFKELQGDDAISLVSLYPELKSDELVKMQIETYQANNQKIKELRESKINASNYKWWLYFGK